MMAGRKTTLFSAVLGLALLALIAAAACIDRYDPVRPSPIAVHAAGEKQIGGLGPFCWSSQPEDGVVTDVCVTTSGVEFDEDALVVNAGDALTLDFSDTGLPKDARYEIYRYDAAVDTFDDREGPRIIRSCCMIRGGVIPSAEAVEFPIDLEPGRYVMTVFGRFHRGGTTQGFHIVVER